MRTPQELIDAATDSILADPDYARQFIAGCVNDALPLIVKAEWDMEDNFQTTETLTEEVGKHLEEITHEEARHIAKLNYFEPENIDLDHVGEDERPIDV